MLLETVPLLVQIFDPVDEEHLAFVTRRDVVVPIFGSLYIDADKATIFYRDKQLSLSEAIAWVDREPDKDLWIIVSGRVKLIGKTSEHVPTKKTYIDNPADWVHHLDATELWLLDRYALHLPPSRDQVRFMETPESRTAERKSLSFLKSLDVPFSLTPSKRPEAESVVVKALLAQPEYEGWFHVQADQDFLLQSIRSKDGQSVQLADMTTAPDLAKRLGAILHASGVCGEEPVGGYHWTTLEEIVADVEWSLRIR